MQRNIILKEKITIKQFHNCGTEVLCHKEGGEGVEDLTFITKKDKYKMTATLELFLHIDIKKK